MIPRNFGKPYNRGFPTQKVGTKQTSVQANANNGVFLSDTSTRNPCTVALWDFEVPNPQSDVDSIESIK